MSHLFGGYFDNEFSKNYSIKRGTGIEENNKEIISILDEFNKTEIDFNTVNYKDNSNNDSNNDSNNILDKSILIPESIILDESIIIVEKPIELNESILLVQDPETQKVGQDPKTQKVVLSGKAKKYSDGLNPYRSNFISSIIAKKISLI